MNIFFSGIGGVGLGPLAEIASDAGYRVVGSDARDGLVIERLRDKGISISLTQDGSFLKSCHDENPIDLFIYTSALPLNHPELVLAKALGIKTAKRDELLARILQAKNLKLIAVAGTHGKTTTTGMAVWTFQKLGIPISYSVGTTLNFGPSGKFDPRSQYFVYECDEFDRNFLNFSPYLSVITSLDYDHPDTYPSKASYFEAFQQFTSQSEHVIMWRADSQNIRLTRSSWVLSGSEVAPLNLAGEHNRRNASLVIKALEYLNLGSWDEVRAALNSFPGTDRRFERLADNLYSDYGHHPVEIAATLQLARELADQVVLIYQPHQNVRQYEIKAQYTDCFEQAGEVIWLPTYLSREDPNLPILQPQELTENITNKAAVSFATLNDDLWKIIQKSRHKGKLVLAMGAGDIDGWLRNHIK